MIEISRDDDTHQSRTSSACDMFPTSRKIFEDINGMDMQLPRVHRKNSHGADFSLKVGEPSGRGNTLRKKSGYVT